MKELFQKVTENASYVAGFFLVIVGLFVVAVIAEKLVQKKKGVREPLFYTKKTAVIGVFSGIAMLLMLFEFPLPFAPTFYELDFSEVPILIGSFAFGPAAGVMMEFLKILLKLFIKGTSTAFIGDLANFVVGCSFVLPAAIVYTYKKTKKTAITACVTGTLFLTVFGTAFNAIYLLPAFAAFYGMPLDTLIEMGMKVNPMVREGDIVSFVVACVAPLNLLKGLLVSTITMLVYKRVSPIIK